MSNENREVRPLGPRDVEEKGIKTSSVIRYPDPDPDPADQVSETTNKRS